jgi:hypothetical protein
MTEKANFDTLKEIVYKGKATPEQEIEYANLLISNNQEAIKAKKQASINEVKALMAKHGLTEKDLKPQPEVIFEYTDTANVKHIVYSGTKGKRPEWQNTFKTNHTKAKALALATTDKAKAFIENLYKA